MNTGFYIAVALLMATPVAASEAGLQGPAQATVLIDGGQGRESDTDDFGRLVLALKERFADRYAGAYLESGQMIVRLTGEGKVAAEVHGVVEVIFQPGARHTLEELSAALLRGEEVIAERLPRSFGRHIDERTGEIVVGVEANQLSTKLDRGLSQDLGVPVRLEAQEPAILN